jgi:peroxiredoxin
MIGEGALAPDFELEDDGGAKVRLSDFRGRPVVLYFYPKDDTPDAPRRPAASATPGASSSAGARLCSG